MIAGGFIGQGAKVYISSRKAEVCNAVAEELGPNCIAVPQDISTVEGCKALAATMAEHEERIDVLVNNAGAAGPKYTLRDIPFTDVEMRAAGSDQTMFDSAMNLLGAPWNMARAAAAHLSDGGTIVNVSTIFSRTHYYGRIPYVVPKSGLNALGKGLALELGEERGIRVNTCLLYTSDAADE